MKEISVCKFLCDYFLFSVICCQNQNIGRDVNVLHRNQGRNFSVIVLYITSAYVPRGLSVHLSKGEGGKSIPHFLVLKKISIFLMLNNVSNKSSLRGDWSYF